MPREDGGEEEPARAPARPLGPVWRRVYEPNPGKHAEEEHGIVSREPREGQEALDYSVRVKPTSFARISVDWEERVFVVLRRHLWAVDQWPNAECFPGYVVPWEALQQDMRNRLIAAGMADRRGRIL
jgi:hypothetical protein